MILLVRGQKTKLHWCSAVIYVTFPIKIDTLKVYGIAIRYANNCVNGINQLINKIRIAPMYTMFHILLANKMIQPNVKQYFVTAMCLCTFSKESIN